jgi:hypothetical protein
LRGTPSPIIATFIQESNEGKGRKVSPKPATTKVAQIILALGNNSKQLGDRINAGDFGRHLA